MENENLSSTMIKISGLKKSYGDFEALRGLNFSVPKGQVVGFLGPNGAGKSTTMKILTGYLPYASGSVMVGGIEVADDPNSTRKMIGYLPENNPQYEEMMVMEYLQFIADIRNIPKADQPEKIKRSVEACGLASVVHKDIGQLSKGFRQRVGLAQATLHEPQVLILDEPTSGLDPNQIIEIRELIKEIGKKTTVLMSTHILQEAQSTCERILIINNGLLVADDTPEELTGRDYGAIFVEVASKDGSLLDASNITKKFEKIHGVTSVKSERSEKPNQASFTVRYENADPRKDLFNAAVGENLILLEMRRHKASLEETFRRLTTSTGA